MLRHAPTGSAPRRTTPARLAALAGALWVTGLLSASPSGEGQDPRDHALEFRSDRDTVLLPETRWYALGDRLTLAEFEFAVEKSGNRLTIDTNADGRVDKKIGAPTGRVSLKAKRSIGSTFRYDLELRHTGARWEWTPSGGASGRLGNVAVRIIDLSGNGEFDDFGRDAMVLGKAEAACYLSRVVDLGGALFQLEVDANGTTATTRPYAGDTAEFDVAAGFDSEGELAAAVFRDGDISFELVSKTSAHVPVGDYQFVGGLARKGSDTATIGPGRMPIVRLRTQDTFELAWGRPVRGEFSYRVDGERLQVDPNVQFFGAFGEEYLSFAPYAASPSVLVHDRATGKLVQYGRMGGCCGGGFSAFVAPVPRGLDLEISLEHRRALFGDIIGHPRKAPPRPSGKSSGK